MIGELFARVDGDRLVDLRSTPPLGAKFRLGECGPELIIVGTAASLLEGDDIRLVIDVGAGSSLRVVTTAAQIAHPCPRGGTTRLAIDVTVGNDARLRWCPEPTIVCGGGCHLGAARVELSDGAVVDWLDELVLGRSGESPESANVETSLVVDGPAGPILRDGFDSARPGAHGSAVAGGVRYLGSWHRWGERTAPAAPIGIPPGNPAPGRVTRFDLGSPGAMWRLLSTDVATGRSGLAEATRPWNIGLGSAATFDAMRSHG